MREKNIFIEEVKCNPSPILNDNKAEICQYLIYFYLDLARPMKKHS